MKEQKQQLNKIQIPTTQLGKVESSAGGNTPTIAPIAPDKSSGERLAAALDITVKAGAHIYEQVDEQKTAFDVIEATAAATEYTSNVLNEAAKLPGEREKQDLYAKKTKEFFEGYKSKYQVSDKAFVAGTGVVSKVFGTAAQESTNREVADTIANMKEDTRKFIATTILSKTPLDDDEDPDGAKIIEFLGKKVGLNKQEAGKFYMEEALVILSNMVRDDYEHNKPITLDTYTSWINRYLKVKTKDGIKYENHSVYGPLIRNFEDSISKLAAVQAKQNEGLTYMKMYTDFSTLKVGDIKGLRDARDKITANMTNLTGPEFDKLHSYLNKVESGETIADNQENLRRAFLAVHKGAEPTAAFFAKFGINEVKNMNTLIHLHKKPANEKDLYVTKYESILKDKYKPKHAYDTGTQQKKILALEKFTDYTRNGMPSSDAYLLVLKEVPLDEVKAPTGKDSTKNLKNLTQEDINEMFKKMNQ